MAFSVQSTYPNSDTVTYTVSSCGEYRGVAVGTLFIMPSDNLEFVSAEVGEAIANPDKVSQVNAIL